MDRLDQSLDKPRLLCLHGAGLTGEVFKMQLRQFLKSLAPYFRLVFVDGPFESEMHPAVALVYGGMGPYCRWFCWKPHHPVIEREKAVQVLEDHLKSAMRNDAGTGEWVGLLGFSQGAHLAASILLDNQYRKRDVLATEGFAGVWWKFGIIMAGGAPLRSMSAATFENRHLSDPGSMVSLAPADDLADDFPEKLKTPTLHVHGLQDAGLDRHRRLYRYWCDPDSASLIEWNAGHRLPFKTDDVATVTQGILEVAKSAQ